MQEQAGSSCRLCGCLSDPFRPAPVSDGSALEESSVACALEEVVPLRLVEVSQAGHGQARRQLEAALHRYHYLGYLSRVGQNLQYWVCDKQARPVGCVVFGAPAWQCAVRDRGSVGVP